VEASTWKDRLIGLLGRASLDTGEALWLRANGVHTFGMRFPIDIVVLDREGRVLRIAGRVPPNRIVWPARGGHATIELPAGTAEITRLNETSTLQRQVL
jgi:uncharacterized membrane protein (UPF0127 family)